MKKRVLSVLLSMVMVLGLLPTVAFAGDSGGTSIKTIQLGTSGIKSPTTVYKEQGGSEYYQNPQSYVYFGNNGNYK